jgi:hypothetical protein
MLNKTYIKRLTALLEIGFPLAAEKKRIRKLNFDTYMSLRTGAGCLLGWWCTTDYAKKSGWTASRWWDDLCPTYKKHSPERSTMEYFGITYEESSLIFGPTWVSPLPLSKRREVVKSILKRKLEAIE